MQTEHLITMANQIGDFFKSFPDQTQAKKDIAQHMQRYWAGSMCKQLLIHVHEHHGSGLQPIVCEAVSEYLDSPVSSSDTRVSD
jgi:formate dehydrogenase subunit delta